MKISIILGTRPEIVKFSPIIRECERLHLDYFILHTGQHYSYNMDKIFFEQLELPNVKYNIEWLRYARKTDGQDACKHGGNFA